MIMILKRINDNINVADIRVFLEPALAGGLFKSAGYVKNLQILKFLTNDAKISECHAILRIDPDRVAKRVIKQLNRKPFLGKPINVVRYFVRDVYNDPRKSRYQIANNRRKADRRRANLKVIDITSDCRWQRVEPTREINWY
jgi:hypothetical protein